MLTFANTYPGVIDETISLATAPNANEAKYEFYDVELDSPSSGNVVATSTTTVVFVNSQASVTDVTGEPYAAYQNVFGPANTLIGKEFFNPDGSLYLAETIGPNASGETVHTFFAGSALSGKSYSQYTQVYNSGVFAGTDYLYANVTGEPYSSYEYDYSAGDDFIGSKTYYTSVPSGANYTSEEYDDDGAGAVTRIAFAGVTGAPYSAYEYDYVGGVFSGSKFTYTTVPSAASYSSYEVDYDQANALAGERFYTTDVTGQTYTGEEEDFDASGHLARVLFTGIEERPIPRSSSIIRPGLTRATRPSTPSPARPIRTRRSTSRLRARWKRSSIRAVRDGLVVGRAGLQRRGARPHDLRHHRRHRPDLQRLSGRGQRRNALQETFDLNSGGHALVALTGGQTLTSQGDDKMTGSGATTFVFNAVYGADTIANLTSADTVSLPSSEFANFAALTAPRPSRDQRRHRRYRRRHADAQGMTTAELAEMVSNFVFHG